MFLISHSLLPLVCEDEPITGLERMSYVTCRLSNECRCQSQWHRLRLPVGLAAERPPTGYVESTANSNNRVVYEVVTLHSGCTVDASLHQTMTTFYRLCWRAIIVTNSISGSRVRSDRSKQRASSSDIHKHMLTVTSLAYPILLINKSVSSQNNQLAGHAPSWQHRSTTCFSCCYREALWQVRLTLKRLYVTSV